MGFASFSVSFTFHSRPVVIAGFERFDDPIYVDENPESRLNNTLSHGDEFVLYHRIFALRYWAMIRENLSLEYLSGFIGDCGHHS